MFGGKKEIYFVVLQGQKQGDKYEQPASVFIILTRFDQYNISHDHRTNTIFQDEKTTNHKT